MTRTDTFPGSIDRPGTSWRWRVSVEGERHRYTLPKDGDGDLPPDPTKDDVAAFARREYDRLKDEARKGTSRAVPFSELLEEFEDRHIPTLAESTQRTYRDELRAYRAFFVQRREDPRARDITSADVSSYLDWRRMHGPDGEKREEPLSGYTVKRTRAVLHRAFAKGQEWGYCRSNPVAGTEQPKPDERDAVILEEGAYNRLVEECHETNPMLGTYALVLGETGMRSNSEALWIQWQDIDLEDGFIQVVSGRDGHRTKSGEGRDVPITPRLEEALREHAARFRMKTYDGGRSRWIFHHTFANRGKEAGDRINSMSGGLTSAAERAGLPDRWRPHDLRHRRVTVWLAQGKSPVKVKEAVGHANLETTMKYYKYVRAHLRSLVEDSGGTELEAKIDQVMGMLRQVVGEAGEDQSAAGGR